MLCSCSDIDSAWKGGRQEYTLVSIQRKCMLHYIDSYDGKCIETVLTSFSRATKNNVRDLLLAIIIQCPVFQATNFSKDITIFNAT